MTTTTLTLDETAYADFATYLATGEDPHGLVSPDVLAEMTFPNVTFRLEGKEALDAARERVSARPWKLGVYEVLPTAEGFAAVIDVIVVNHHGEEETAHTATIVTLTDGRMVRMQHWCSGPL